MLVGSADFGAKVAGIGVCGGGGIPTPAEMVFFAEEGCGLRGRWIWAVGEGVAGSWYRWVAGERKEDEDGGGEGRGRSGGIIATAEVP